MGSPSALTSAARDASPGKRAQRVYGRLAHARVFAARQLHEGGLRGGIADRAQRPDRIDLRLRIRVRAVRGGVLRRLQQGGCRAAIAETPEGEGQVTAHARVVARGLAERAHGLVHEPRVLQRGVLVGLQDLGQLEGGLPPPVRAARADLVEVLPRTFPSDAMRPKITNTVTQTATIESGKMKNCRTRNGVV
jgi:hypothetical protein